LTCFVAYTTISRTTVRVCDNNNNSNNNNYNYYINYSTTPKKYTMSHTSGRWQ